MIKKTTLLLVLILSGFFTKAQSYSNPESAVWNEFNNSWYVSNSNAGQIIKRDASGSLSVFKSGISPSPYGLDIVGNVIYACCGGNVYGYDLNTGAQVFNINTGGTFLNGICHNEQGFLFVSDFSNQRIYRISPAGNSSNIMASNLVQSPNGMYYDQPNNRIIFVNWGNNARIKSLSLADSTVNTLVTTSYGNLDGIIRDNAGRYYISSWSVSGIVRYDADLQNPEVVFTGMSQPADIGYSPFTDTLAVPATGNDNVLFFDLNSEIIIPCEEVPFDIVENDIVFTASDFIVESDSTLLIPIINTSAYNYAYPLMQIIPQNELPEGTSFYYPPGQFEVFASSWNIGDTAYARFPFVVAEEINPNYILDFRIRVTNLDPAPVDTCFFEALYSINLRPESSTGIVNKEKDLFRIFPNPSKGTVFLNSLNDIETIEIYSSDGKLNQRLTQPVPAEFQLNASGMYFYRIIDAKGNVITGRILKD